MIVLTLALAGMLLALVGRYGWAGLARLARLRLRGEWLALLACLAQLAHILVGAYRLELVLLTGALLAWFCWLNRRQAGVLLALAGVTLNIAVMAANGGAMPVSQATLARMGGATAGQGAALTYSKDRVINDDQAALAILGDRLLLPGPLAGIAAWSIGDVLLLAGVGWLFWHTMKGTSNDVQTFRSRAPLP